MGLIAIPLLLLVAAARAASPVGAAGRCSVAQECGPSTRTVKLKANANSLNRLQDAAMLAPSPRAYHSGIKAGTPVSNMTFLAVFGGCTDLSQGDAALSDTWILDLVSRVWFNVTFSGAVPLPRFAHDASATSDMRRMVIYGGLVPHGYLNNSCRDGATAAIAATFAADTWLLDPHADDGSRQWLRLNASGPLGRAGHSLATLQGGVLLFGGLTAANNATDPAQAVPGSYRPAGAAPLRALNDTWLFVNQSWVQVAADPAAPRPASRHSHSAVTMALPNNTSASHVVVFGGTALLTAAVDQESQFFNDIWAFDEASLGWRQIAVDPSSPLPPPRHSHSAVVSNAHTMIIYGGADPRGEHLRDVWEYDPATSVWTELQPWFQGSNKNYSAFVRSTVDNFAYRDVWGHVGLTVSSEVSAADSFVTFGGLYSELYFASVNNDVYEFVRGMTPSTQHLVQWRTLTLGSGPFHRVQHTLINRGQPANTSVSGYACLPSWTYNGTTFHHCAKPLGWDDYICAVAANQSDVHCMDSTLFNVDPDTPLLWDFCGQTTLLLFGGRYDGDIDHISVADPPGMVWNYDVTDSYWQVDELKLNNQTLPPPISLHAMAKVGGYQLPRPQPPAWSSSLDATEEGYLVFGGEVESSPHTLQLGILYYYQPPKLGRLSAWTELQPQLDASMALARLPRSEPAMAVHAYSAGGHLIEDVYVFGGYWFRGWADRPPAAGASLFLRYSVSQNTWYSLSAAYKPGDHVPAGRFAHTFVYVAFPQPLFVLFGGEVEGTRVGSRLMNDTWIYNLTSHRWLQLQPPPADKGDVFHTVPWPGPREGHASAAYGSKIYIQGGKRYVNNRREIIDTDSMCAQEADGCAFCDLWVLDVSQVSSLNTEVAWTPLPTSGSCDDGHSPMLRHHAASIVRGVFYTFGGYEDKLGYASNSMFQTVLGCVAGQQSNDLFLSACQSCAAGSYAPDQGYLCCLSCGPKLSTVAAGSTTPAACSVCAPKQCGRGNCSVDEDSRIQCTCPLGYLELDHCGKPWLFILPTFGLAGLLTAIVLVQWFRAYYHNQEIRQMQLLQSQREVEELSRGWEIQIEEVKLTERIDLKAPGACGEVWLAEWQGMRVAFKKLNRALLELDEAGYTAEFDREVRFMRSIRHPNIVLFFGAGRMVDNTPFLVTEYMACGSLQAVLHDPDKAIDLSLKIRFALDAAKGMRFLHFCKPPRIHRDLKTGNLLVNDRWVVKVADFGTSRLLEGTTATATTAAAGTTAGVDSNGRLFLRTSSTSDGAGSSGVQSGGGGGASAAGAVGGDRVHAVAAQARAPQRASPSAQRPGLSINGEKQGGKRLDDGDDDDDDDELDHHRANLQSSQPLMGRPPLINTSSSTAGTKSSATTVPQAEQQAALFLTRHVGTPLYMAPEVMAGQPHSRASDVYSFGVVLCEIYMRQIPFERLATGSVFKLRKEVQDGYRPDLAPDCPPQLAQLIKSCWAAAPNERPTFDVIVSRLTAMAELSSLYGNQLTPKKPEVSSGGAQLHSVVSVGAAAASSPVTAARNIFSPRKRPQQPAGPSLWRREPASLKHVLADDQVFGADVGRPRGGSSGHIVVGRTRGGTGKAGSPAVGHSASPAAAGRPAGGGKQQLHRRASSLADGRGLGLNLGLGGNDDDDDDDGVGGVDDGNADVEMFRP